MDDKSIDKHGPLIKTSDTRVAYPTSSGMVTTQNSQLLVSPQATITSNTIKADDKSLAFASLSVTGTDGFQTHIGHVINNINLTYSSDRVAPPLSPYMLTSTPRIPGPDELRADVTQDEIDTLPEEQREIFKSAMECYNAGQFMFTLDYLKSSEYHQTALAQRILGHCQIDRDFKMGAFSCFKISAEKGDSKAQFYVGWCFEYRYGTNLCKESAFLWYTRSAQQGNPKALKALRNIEWLGQMYKSIECSTDVQSPLGWFHEVFKPGESDEFISTIKEYANSGATEAQRLLTWIDYFSASNKSDENLTALVLSALNGHKLAQFELQKRVVSSLAIDVICYHQEMYQIWCKMLTPVNATPLTSGTPEDNAKIFNLLISTKTESALSGRLLGICYAYGIGTEKSDALALDFFKRAEENGDELAHQHLELWDTKKAAEAGNANMAYELYWQYKNGQDVKVNLKKAFCWVWIAAEGGSFEAQNALGSCYENGEGTEIDLPLAMHYYQKASHKSNCAMFNLGSMYEKGNGVEKNFDEAVKCYKKAAEDGHFSAQILLGELYYDGKNVEKNIDEAIKWYKKAAEAGHSGAQFWLGELYYHGKGVPEDYQLGHYWYEKAARANPPNPKATYRLGMTYVHGYIGYMNLNMAKEWLQRAAALGDQSAKNRLDEPQFRHLELGKALAECFLAPSAFEKLNLFISSRKPHPE